MTTPALIVLTLVALVGIAAITAAAIVVSGRPGRVATAALFGAVSTIVVAVVNALGRVP